MIIFPQIFFRSGKNVLKNFRDRGEQRKIFQWICLLWRLNEIFSGGDPRESVGGICESPKFKMAAVGHVDNCILSVLAHIAALDLGSGVIWGNPIHFWCQFYSFTYGLPGIQIQNWPPLAILNTILKIWLIVLLNKWLMGFWETMNLHSMSFCRFDIIMTLNPYYPKSKMAAIAFLNTISTIWVIVLLYKRFLELGAINKIISYCMSV